jgi:hypothetical protein
MGEVFGRYELLRRIGVGGMAEVFQARTFGPQGFVKDVVIKRILGTFSEDPEFVRMFINEARLAAKLQHANIVQIFDFNQVDGVYYIAMEWVDGTDLRRVVNKSRSRSMPVPIRMGVHVGVETLKGLHYASTRTEDGRPLSLVHRDISPHNLLVSRSGEVKITDFGIAKVAALASSTRSGMLKGKLAYMSPEQAGNQPLDARSDIYSLGVVLWELLTGRRLFEGESEAELFAQVKQAEIPSPRALRPELPEGVERAVLRMLAVRPDDRFGSAAEALEQLSCHAEVGDALTVGAYLRELMPDELAQEGRGETTVLPPDEAAVVPTVAPASPDASTHTRAREEAEAAVELVVPMVPPPERPPPESTLSEMRAIRRRPALLLAAVAAAGICGILGWWIAGGLTPAVQPLTTASVRVESDPPGAELWVDDLHFGKTPQVVEGQPGRLVALRARLGGRERAEKRMLAGDERWVLQLDPAAPPRPASSEAPASARAPRDSAASSDHRSAAASPPPPPRAPRRGTKHGSKVRQPDVRATASAWGYLDVLVSPWAKVRIDGRDFGHTPLRSHRLAPGKHRVEVFNPELDRRKVLTVEIAPGQRHTIRKNWE